MARIPRGWWEDDAIFDGRLTKAVPLFYSLCFGELMEWILILIVSGVIASYAYGVGNRFGRKLGGYMIREHRRYRLPRE